LFSQLSSKLPKVLGTMAGSDTLASVIVEIWLGYWGHMRDLWLTESSVKLASMSRSWILEVLSLLLVWLQWDEAKVCALVRS
jgi:hypothetical protein